MKDLTPCPEWAEMLAARHSEDLSSSELAALNAHIASCSTCGTIRDEYNMLIAEFCALPPIKPLPSYTPQLLYSRNEITTEEQTELLSPLLRTQYKKQQRSKSSLHRKIETNLALLVVAIIILMAIAIFQRPPILIVASIRLLDSNLLAIIHFTRDYFPILMVATTGLLAISFYLRKVIGRRKILRNIVEMVTQIPLAVPPQGPQSILSPHLGNFRLRQRNIIGFVIIFISFFVVILGFSVLALLALVTGTGLFFFAEPINGALHDFSAWSAKGRRVTINGAKRAISKLPTNFSIMVAIPLIVSLVVSSIVSLITLGMISDLGSISTSKYQCDSQKIAPISANGIGVFQAADGECTGLSDGAFAFDSDRPGGNGDLKRLAVEKFNLHDIKASKSLWQQELAVDSNDAETLIYLENQRIQSSPHITLVVATILTGKYVNIGRDNLQGAYIAQKEYNDGYKLPGGLQLHLLIANFGSDPANATKVANQIVQAQRADPTIVGVMGLPFSSYIPDTMEVLAKAHIPMVSQSASSDDLTSISPFFFRIVPPNKVQAMIGARYAVQQLHAHKIALFYDPGDSYSDSLGEDFRQQVLALGGTIVAETYIVGQPEKLPRLLQNAQSHHPDLLYFAGHATDLNTLLIDLPKSELSTHVVVMGGDALYEVKDYTSSARAGFLRLHFTAFASPDEWMYLGVQKPSFFTEYQSAFDPDNQHFVNPYSYSRPDNNVIVSYDATMVLLNAYQIALPQGRTSLLTPDELKAGLTHTTDAQAYQGISGQISFGKNGDPINKAIVILYVDQNGFIRLDSINRSN